ncbi:hypothetical protein MG293_010296 [Ovis ammon polii]|uniref:Uncharacterized protein n=1 Tax=Ovis ammon polii TaxID=230172 RepID=A0AAD4U621_OVIAM|nr:hypothetical protein MG293_010296 [Ovis ammon polii]
MVRAGEGSRALRKQLPGSSMVLIRRIGQLQTHQKGHNLARTLQRRPWHLKLTFAAGNEIRVCIKVIPLLSTQLFSKSFLRQSSKRLCYFLISELISCQTSIRCTYEGVSETGLQTRVNKECYYDLSCLPVVQACRGCDRGEDLRLLPSECPEPSFYLLLRNQAQGPYPEAGISVQLTQMQGETLLSCTDEGFGVGPWGAVEPENTPFSQLLLPGFFQEVLPICL